MRFPNSNRRDRVAWHKDYEDYNYRNESHYHASSSFPSMESVDTCDYSNRFQATSSHLQPFPAPHTPTRYPMKPLDVPSNYDHYTTPPRTKHQPAAARGDSWYTSYSSNRYGHNPYYSSYSTRNWQSAYNTPQSGPNGRGRTGKYYDARSTRTYAAISQPPEYDPPSTYTPPAYAPQSISEANERLREKLRAARSPAELRQLLDECRNGNPAVGWFEKQMAERKLAKCEVETSTAPADDATLDAERNSRDAVGEKEEIGDVVGKIFPCVEGDAHHVGGSTQGSTNESSHSDEDKENKEKALNPGAKVFIPSSVTGFGTKSATASKEPERDSAGGKYYNDLRLRGQKVLERMRQQQLQSAVWDAPPEVLCPPHLMPDIAGKHLAMPASSASKHVAPVLDTGKHDGDLGKSLLCVPTPGSSGMRKGAEKYPRPSPSIASVEFALTECGLSKFRDACLERGVDFLDRASNHELVELGMKENEVRRLRRFQTKLNPQAAEFFPGAGQPPLMQLPGAAPPPAPHPGMAPHAPQHAHGQSLGHPLDGTLDPGLGGQGFSEALIEEPSTKFDFFDCEEGWVDNFEAFHDDIPEGDFDFSQCHEFDFPSMMDQTQWGNCSSNLDSQDESASQSRLKVFSDFAKSSESSSYHVPLSPQ